MQIRILRQQEYKEFGGQMSRSIHLKVDDKTFEEWLAIGRDCHGLRATLLRRKVREVIDAIKCSPLMKVEKKEEEK
jgi:glycosyltransferase A (GT-A) superfamily protein (DUF2064 family)